MDLTVPLKSEGERENEKAVENAGGRRSGGEASFYINSFDGFRKMRYDEDGNFIGRGQETAVIRENGNAWEKGMIEGTILWRRDCRKNLSVF